MVSGGPVGGGPVGCRWLIVGGRWLDGGRWFCNTPNCSNKKLTFLVQLLIFDENEKRV